MLIAMNQKGERISIYSFSKEDLLSLRKEKWLCPSCKAPVFMKIGVQKQPHFSHYRQGQCQTFSEGETAEHIAGKQLLARWFELQNIPYQLEASLPEIQQRPDLLIDMKQPIAIEFQCSPLSANKMYERTMGYLNNGYGVIWMVGKKLTPTHKLTSLQRQFIAYQEQLGFYLFSLDVNQKHIKRYCQVMTTFSEYLSSETIQTIFTLTGANHKKVQDLVTAPKNISSQKEELTVKNIEQQQKQLSKALYYAKKQHLIVQEKLYMKQTHALHLPVEAYFPLVDSPFINTPAYYWRYLLLCHLSNLGVDHLVHLKELKKWWQEKVTSEEISYYPSPLVQKHPFVALKKYLQFLQKMGILKKEKDSQYRLTKKIKWMFTK